MLLRLSLLRLSTLLLRLVAELLVHVLRALLDAIGLRPQAPRVDLDVALDVLDAKDPVIDRAEWGEDEVDVFEEHGCIAPGYATAILAPRRYLGW